MKKHAIVVLVLFYFINASFAEDHLLMLSKKEWADWEGNKFEKIIFICGNDEVVRFKSDSKNRITIKLPELLKGLARAGNSLATVEAVIHAHIWPQGFSEDDIQMYRTLCKYGFKGKFMVYYPERGILKSLNSWDPD